MESLQLERDGLVFHQLMTFAPGPVSVAEELERSPLFDVEPLDGGARAEWIRYTEEDERFFFPLGRIAVHPQGLLLETYSELRMAELRRRVDGLGILRITADQFRLLNAGDAIRRPSGLLQPLEELEERELTRHDVARTYLRMAWPFFARADLSGRCPYQILGTGRGRASLEAVLEKLPVELERWDPRFPVFDPEELRELLMPSERTIPAPSEEPSSAHERERS